MVLASLPGCSLHLSDQQPHRTGWPAQAAACAGHPVPGSGMGKDTGKGTLRTRSNRDGDAHRV